MDQLLSPESLRSAGYFDPAQIAGARAASRWLPAITPRRLGLDLGLTRVVSTQLWHHTFIGGLCDLPTWVPPEAPTAGSPLSTVRRVG